MLKIYISHLSLSCNKKNFENYKIRGQLKKSNLCRNKFKINAATYFFIIIIICDLIKKLNHLK